jgi:hypothetical protein
MFGVRGVQLNRICDCLRAIVRHRLGEHETASFLCLHAAYGIGSQLPPHPVEAALCRVAATRVGVNVERLLAPPIVDRAYRAGYDRAIDMVIIDARRGETNRAYGLFEHTLSQWHETWLPLRRDDAFKSAVALLGRRGNATLEVYDAVAARQCDHAARISDQLVAEYPEDFRSYWLRGFAHAKLAEQHAYHRESEQCVTAIGVAVEALSKSIALEPKQCRSHALLASLRGNAPIVNQRNPQEAIELARQALSNIFGSHQARIALGVAKYRLRDWAGAAAELEAYENYVLETSALHSWEPCSSAGYVQAMAYWRLGNREKAVMVFNETSAELTKYSAFDDYESIRLRQEAESLLGGNDSENANNNNE